MGREGKRPTSKGNVREGREKRRNGILPLRPKSRSAE